MPLPAANLAWPPRELGAVLPSLAQWSAWYDGRPEVLRAVYGNGMAGVGVGPQLELERMRQHRGGLRNALARFWWGRPYLNGVNMLQRDQIHIPIASDICQASADLLFADQPKMTVTDDATQQRLDLLADDGMYSIFAEAAEIGAALGGVYLRVTWDKIAAPDGPFLTAIHADAAWPEFQWGILRAVTFWTVLNTDERSSNIVWRHLERHELDSQGNGIILHGLYKGTPENLGQPQPLTEQSVTNQFAPLVDINSAISTQSPGLAVEYIPNQRPQRRWRSDPVGSALGRSDLDGIESLMDALDEVYASWMRDIRLGKARILIAKSLLQNMGPGQGSMFDAEQEAYSQINALADPDSAGKLPIEQIQFDIRVAEHQQSAQQLIEDILRTAGYSQQTFGEGDTGTVRTATEIESKERRSLMTRDRKIRLMRPGMSRILMKLLAVDKAIFGTQVTAQPVEVLFTDGVQETQLALAQTVQALYAADAASTAVRVGIVHPDWDDQKIADEVALIGTENATRVGVLASPDEQPVDDPTSSI